MLCPPPSLLLGIAAFAIATFNIAAFSSATRSPIARAEEKHRQLFVCFARGLVLKSETSRAPVRPRAPPTLELEDLG